MSNKTQLQTNNTALDALITRVNAAKDVAASLPEASGGGSVETCTMTIVQEWGMNQDPELLILDILYYNILPDGTVEKSYTTLTSYYDNEPEHSITCTVVKNMPIFLVFHAASSMFDATTITTSNGIVEDIAYQNGAAWMLDQLTSSKILSLTPTADTATFTFSSP